ncbi:hypothetical protein SAMN05216389_101286 [Oceanobacillus limi]|uniref:Uncharacterized protein n=1 Tax=Oceanobacillus limi TaxID=930131 RepID=A0A1H9YAE5_9BACI|nr:hypothetical protein [Oceanobacillus limi]SES65921.1 hypothetical protein SAMN05216389_101286 [Oceanobacillus limi]
MKIVEIEHMFLYNVIKEVITLTFQLICEKNEPYFIRGYDALWKKLIAGLFEEFIQFFAPELYHAIDFSKRKEFLQHKLYQQLIANKKDQQAVNHLVKVILQNGDEKWILIHIGVQDSDTQHFHKKMFQYFYQILDRYDQEIYTIALLTNNSSKSNDYYYHSFYDSALIYVFHSYDVEAVRITELKKSTNPFATVVLAVKYANSSRNNTTKRYSLKRNLLIHIFTRFPIDTKRNNKYIHALVFFIDYQLPLPKELQQKLIRELATYFKKEKIIIYQNSWKSNQSKLAPTLLELMDYLDNRH